MGLHSARQLVGAASAIIHRAVEVPSIYRAKMKPWRPPKRTVSCFQSPLHAPVVGEFFAQNSGVEVRAGQAYNQRKNSGIPDRPVAPTQLAAHAAINNPAKRFADEQR